MLDKLSAVLHLSADGQWSSIMGTVPPAEGLALLAFTAWRYWRTQAPVATPGRLAGEFLIGYAIARSVSEIFREPDEGISLILGLSRGTFYSIGFVIVGIVLIVRSRPSNRT